MKLSNFLSCSLLIAAIAITSSVNADWWDLDEPEISIKTGVITDIGVKMGYEHGEHLTYIDLDQTTRWEIENFDLFSELNWSVGDNLKIFVESGEYHHTALNLDRHNHAFLILIK